MNPVVQRAISKGVVRPPLRWERNRSYERNDATTIGLPALNTFQRSPRLIDFGGRRQRLPIAVVLPSSFEVPHARPLPAATKGSHFWSHCPYLLGNDFRQLPSNERSASDVFRDIVCRGMTLIAAASCRGKTRVCSANRNLRNNSVQYGALSSNSRVLAHRKLTKPRQGIDHWPSKSEIRTFRSPASAMNGFSIRCSKVPQRHQPRAGFFRLRVSTGQGGATKSRRN